MSRIANFVTVRVSLHGPLQFVSKDHGWAGVSLGVCAISTNAKCVPTWKKGGKFNWQHANEARPQSLHLTKTPNWVSESKRVQRGGPQLGEVVLPKKLFIKMQISKFSLEISKRVRI